VVARVAHVDVSGDVDGDVAWGVELGREARAVLDRGGAVAGERRDVSRRGDATDAVVARVGDEDAAVGERGGAERGVELCDDAGAVVEARVVDLAGEEGGVAGGDVQVGRRVVESILS